jgi:hypothetical protein
MRLEILVGMIGSSKSIYARKRADESALVISHDWLTQGLHGGAYRYEQGLRECYRRMEEDLACAALTVGRNVVLDRCHLSAESRRRWIDFAHRLRNEALIEGDREIYRGLPVVAVAFPIESPAVHARRRFESDPRGRSHEEWYMVAQHHFAQHLAEPLSEDEGFAEIIRPEVNLCEKDSGTS